MKVKVQGNAASASLRIQMAGGTECVDDDSGDSVGAVG